MALFRRLRRQPSAFEFFDRFGDPSSPSIGTFPASAYPDVVIDAAIQIRLLQILPGSFEDEIYCRLMSRALITTQDDEGVSFTALSYTWGGFYNPASITLNGSPRLPISQNLYCCLQRLRSMNHEQWFWIDQICINQNDKKEKSLQVPLMENIYAQATEVVIWLGDHAPGSQVTQSRSHQIEKIVEYAMHGRKDMGLCWWRRLWVLQEYCLASKEPNVQISMERISWSDLCQFTNKYLDGRHSMLAAAISCGVLNNMIERFTVVRDMAQEDHKLLSLAWVFPQLICFDPRDKIYGVLGLLAPGMKAMIKPDYERAKVKDVFGLATYVEITQTRSLGIMSLIRQQALTPDLPSWAVDFVYPQNLEHMHIATLIEIWLDLFRRPPLPWTRVSPQVDAHVDFDKESATLTVTGLEFDDILTAFPIINVKVDVVPQSTSWKRLALAGSSLTSRFVLKREERLLRQQILEPLKSRTAYERLSNEEKAYSSTLLHNNYGIRRILADAIIADWLYHDAHADNECVEEELGQDNKSSEALEGYFDHLAGDFGTSGSSSSFCVTSKGFVGIGPQCMRNTDQIILPYGSRYPMLLRSNSDSTWTFLSFIHMTGLNNNQLWTLLPDLNLREKRFVLT